MRAPCCEHCCCLDFGASWGWAGWLQVWQALVVARLEAELAMHFLSCVQEEQRPALHLPLITKQASKVALGHGHVAGSHAEMLEVPKFGLWLEVMLIRRQMCPPLDEACFCLIA